MRQELSRPVLEGFWAWVEEIRAKYTANESLKKALTYTTNQRTYLETYLEDGRIPISNNDCKTCIRPFAAGRKAWLFANPPASSRCLFLAMFVKMFDHILFRAELLKPLCEAALHSCMKYPLFLRYFSMFSRYNSAG